MSVVKWDTKTCYQASWIERQMTTVEDKKRLTFRAYVSPSSDVSFVILLRRLLDPYQHVWFQGFRAHFPTDTARTFFYTMSNNYQIYYMAIIVRVIWLVAERARFSYNEWVLFCEIKVVNLKKQFLLSFLVLIAWPRLFRFSELDLKWTLSRAR